MSNNLFSADDFAAVTQSIDDFNKLYKLAVGNYPAFHFVRAGEGSVKVQVQRRLEGFSKTLADELEEVDKIHDKVTAGDDPLDMLTDTADWLGDIIVYCLSEMRKYGLEPGVVLGIIMASNMSKLDANGNPIYDEHGKVLKGPNYWQPEPALRRYIEAAVRQHTRGNQPNTGKEA